MYDTTKPYNDRIKELIEKTWQAKHVMVDKNGIFKTFAKHLHEVHHCDGIGTKGDYHWKQRTFQNAVIDALNMNANDLPLYRAKPYAVVDHIMVPQDDSEAIIDILQALSDECVKRKLAITGGETAIHTNMSGLEISLTMLGFKENNLHNHMHSGDVLMGFASSGLHSNGFTKIREIYADDKSHWFREEFTKPTLDYSGNINTLSKFCHINGMMHITGGAFTKLKNVLQDSDVIITRNHPLKPQDIFYEIYSKGVSDEEMYQTFNCGIGFVFSCRKRDAERIKWLLPNMPFQIIGEVKHSGSGKIIIESMFSDRVVEF